MSEFDQFEAAEPTQVEEDPAAAFLAREQDDLAALGETGLEGDSEPVEQTASADFDAFGTQQDETAAPTNVADAGLFDPLGGNDEFTSADPTEDFGSNDPYTAIKSVDVQRQEPEKIRIWREEQVERLAKKDVCSEEKKGEWREAAKKELEDWYKHRAEQLEKAKKTNREGEAAFIQERDENLPGHEWERICRLCDFNPKASRTNKDISRMRSILLQLKQTGIQRS